MDSSLILYTSCFTFSYEIRINILLEVLLQMIRTQILDNLHFHISCHKCSALVIISTASRNVESLIIGYKSWHNDQVASFRI